MKTSIQLMALGSFLCACPLATAVDYSWTGTEVPPNPTLFDGDWSNVSRWDQGMFFPSTDADSASIAPLGDPFFAVTMDLDTHIGALNFNSPNATLDLTNRNFRVDGANDWLAGTVISHNTQVLDSGGGTFTLGLDATATFDRTTLIDTATVDLQGNVKVEALTNNTQLTLTHGATNTGLLEIVTDSAASSKLILTNAPLINSGGGSLGELHFDGTGAGVREFNGDLVNNGDVRVMSNATFSKFGATITNAGSWVVDPGVTLNLSGGGQTFDHNDNGINVLGTLAGSGLTFNFNGGSISNNGLTLSNSTLNIAADAGGGSFTMLGSGGYSGNLKAFHDLTVLSTTNFTGVTAANGFTNDTQLTIESTGTNQARFTVTSGAIENLPAGVFTLTSVDGTTRLEADLTNSGTVSFQGEASYSKNFATLTNTGNITIESGAVLTTGVQQVWNQNGGVLNIQGAFSPSFLTLNYNDGMITGQPITLTSSNLNIGSDAGGGTFLQRGGSTYSGDLKSSHSVTVLSDTVNTGVVTANGFANAGEFKLLSTASGEAKLTITSGALTNQAAGTLSFEGAAGIRTLAGDLVNEGTVQVDGDTSLSGVASTVTNDGAWTVASGVSQRMNAGGGQSFTQQGGTLTNEGEFIADFVTVNFTGGDIIGNPIEITIGELHIGPAAGSGSFVMRRSGVYSGDITANQVVTVHGSTHNAVIMASNPFSVSGLLGMDSVGPNARLDVNNGPLVINGDGEIRFTGSGTLDLRADISNQGLISIEADGTLGTTAKTITNSGQIEADAIGKVVGSSFTNETSGLVTGSGGLDTTQTSFTNSGELAPGDGVGHFEIAGSVTSTATAVLSIEIGGTTPTTEYDQLETTGTAALGGTLAVKLVDLGGGLFLPDPTDTFTVLTAGTLSGAFANVANGGRASTLGGEGSFVVTYNGSTNMVVLSNFADGLPGDYNGDGTVNLADYTVWRNNLGAPAGTLPNDATNTPIGAAQYSQWMTNFGNALPAAGAFTAPVPEVDSKTQCSLLACCAVLFLRRARCFSFVPRAAATSPAPSDPAKVRPSRCGDRKTLSAS